MRFITLQDNIIINIRYGKRPLEHEVGSEKGELGQILQEDGTFITPERTENEKDTELSTEDKVNFLYYKEKGFF